MATQDDLWTAFGWQGLRLEVPEDWNLGRVDGGPESGYARLDDAEIVRAEIEWRTAKRGTVMPVNSLVDRYLENLEKKADKAGLSFAVDRQARVLTDKTWLEGREYEVFSWTADYHAQNLAVRTHPDRIVLVRVLTRPGEEAPDMVARVIQSLRDDNREPQWSWSVYGLQFSMPVGFKLESQELKSGHIKFNFEQGKQVCRVERLSMAQTLLKEQSLADWYPIFFKKQLRDMVVELAPETVFGHPGLRVKGRPRSRFRQIMRPLPWLNPRQRQYLDGLVWHCHESNKICLVDHLVRKRNQLSDVADQIAHGYLCHQEPAETKPRRHAELEART
jgi:hypothetical protein